MSCRLSIDISDNLCFNLGHALHCRRMRCSNLTIPNVPDVEPSIRVLLAQGRWVTVRGLARATLATVEPVHVARHVVPVRQHHGHAILDGFAELWHAAMI